MHKQIALVMRQRFVAEAIADRLKASGDAVCIASDYPRALWYCRDFTPDLVLFEISDASDDTIGGVLALGHRFREAYPGCKRMLFISRSDPRGALDQAIRAKQADRIDGFVTADAGNDFVIASIQALA